MVQITRPPTLFESASDVVQEGLERAREALDTVAERASDAVDTVDVDGVRSMGRDLIGNLQARQQVCTAPLNEARDDERLKSAVIAGVVVFIASLVVLLLAREVAKRRATQRRERRRQPKMSRPEPGNTEG